MQIDMQRVKGTVDMTEPECIDGTKLNWKDNEALILKTMSNNFFRMTQQCLLKLCNCSVYGLNSVEGKSVDH